jgi:hypothetical protein
MPRDVGARYDVASRRVGAPGLVGVGPRLRQTSGHVRSRQGLTLP